MKFFGALTVACLTATTIAAPSGGSSSCAGDQTVSCCNTSDQKQKIGNGVFGLFNTFLSPGSCSPITIPIVGAALQQFCGNNVAQCCENDQTGIINLNLAQCNAIPF